MSPQKATDAKPKRTRQELGPLWTYYRIRWEFITRLCSSVPADPEIIKKWLDAREPRVRPAGAKSIDEINEEVLASLERGEGEASQEFGMLVFQRHAGGLVMRAGTVRAHMKDCARVLSSQYIASIQDEKSFNVRVINGVYHDEQQYWLPICRPDGTPVTEADGAFDKPVHAIGPRGQRINALKRFEYVNPPSVLTFTIKVLGKSVPEEDLQYLFSYGGVHGYGGERGDGEGRYGYTIERLATQEERPTPANGVGDHREARADSGRAGAADDHGQDRRADESDAQGDYERRPAGAAVLGDAAEAAAAGAGAAVADSTLDRRPA